MIRADQEAPVYRNPLPAGAEVRVCVGALQSFPGGTKKMRSAQTAASIIVTKVRAGDDIRFSADVSGRNESMAATA